MAEQETKCKVAIIGAGNMAREHIPAFADVPGVEVVGIHSRTRARAEALAAEFNVPGVYDSIAELYEKTKADLVVVTVFELAMKAVSIACFDYPWAVLMEKPCGLNYAEAQEIYAASQAKKRTALVALNRRFLSSTRAAIEDLRARDVPRFITVYDQQDLETPRIIGHPPEVVHNWMYANSIHMIDYFRLFGRGKITTVEPLWAWNPENPWIVAAKIEFDSGDIGLYEGIWRGPGPWAATVSTAEKRWEMRPLEKAVFQPAGSRKLEDVEVSAWDQQFKPGFRLQAEMAVAAALGQPSETPTLEEALDSMRLVNLIFGQ